MIFSEYPGRWFCTTRCWSSFMRHVLFNGSRVLAYLYPANSLVAISGPWTNSFSYFAVGLTYLRRGPLRVRTVNWEAGKCGTTRDEHARQVLHVGVYMHKFLLCSHTRDISAEIIECAFRDLVNLHKLDIHKFFFPEKMIKRYIKQLL